MENDDKESLMDIGINWEVTACLSNPIALRPGQCWSDGHTIWEIIGWWDNDTLSLIEWKLWNKRGTVWGTPRTGSRVYLTEDHFCNGAGSQHTIDLNHFISWAKLLINLGTEQHNKNGWTTSQIKLIRNRTAMDRIHHTSSNMPPWGHINKKFRDIFTDGSWLKRGTLMEHLDGNCEIVSGGAVVLEETTKYGAPNYNAIYIQGTQQCSKSAYVMELLAICVANDIKRNQTITNTGFIRSDCKAAINKCKRIWNNKASYRSLPLISLSIAETKKPAKLVHVPSHPEIKKPNQEWLDMDCGIYAADAAADGTADFITCRTTDTDVIKHLTRNLDIIITNSNGILMEDMDDRWNRLRSSEYLTRRDAYRAEDTENPRPPRWTYVNPRLMSKMWGIKSTNNEAIGSTVKALWDWKCTGSNRRKGNKDADFRCQLCGAYETQAHIIAYCKDPETQRLRREMFDDCRDDISLLQKGLAQDMAWSIFHLAENKNYLTDFCTGILTPSTKNTITQSIPETILQDKEWKLIGKLLRSFGQYGRKVMLEHEKRTALILSGKTGIKSGLSRTSAGLQRSIQTSMGWQSTSHSKYCMPTKTPTNTNRNSETSQSSNTKTLPNVHDMIRWHRAKPSIETTTRRVKRKHMGTKMKKLFDLTHERKIIWHKFEKWQPEMGTVSLCQDELGSGSEQPQLVTTIQDEEEDEEEPPVKRRYASKNIILDDEELGKILLRTHYGSGRKKSYNRTEHSKTNANFRKKISGMTYETQLVDTEDERGTEIVNIVPNEEEPRYYGGEYQPVKFDLAGNTVPARKRRRDEGTEEEGYPEQDRL